MSDSSYSAVLNATEQLLKVEATIPNAKRQVDAIVKEIHKCVTYYNSQEIVTHLPVKIETLRRFINKVNALEERRIFCDTSCITNARVNKFKRDRRHKRENLY